jgi:hypothetical protein
VLKTSDIATITVECCGVSLHVKCPANEIAAVRARLPVNSIPATPTEVTHTVALRTDGRDRFSVRRGRSWKTRLQRLDVALQVLQKELYMCVAEHATTLVFIHAGVIQVDGTTIVFPGCSHSGKSTLVQSLLQAGAVYYSDEYAVFDEEGLVHPFALPIHLRLASGNREFVTPSLVGSAPVAPGVVAFATYRQNAVWQPRVLQPPEVMLRLIRHSIGIRRNPSFVLPVLKKVSVGARGFLGIRGDSRDLLVWVRDTVKCTVIEQQ